jgi:hypothetical protein
MRRDWQKLHHAHSQVPQRECTKAKVTSRCKRITLPIEMETYHKIVGNVKKYRQWVDEMVDQHPELFPTEIKAGYILHDERGSEKLDNVRLRRFCLKMAEGKSKFSRLRQAA